MKDVRVFSPVVNDIIFFSAHMLSDTCDVGNVLYMSPKSFKIQRLKYDQSLYCFKVIKKTYQSKRKKITLCIFQEVPNSYKKKFKPALYFDYKLSARKKFGYQFVGAELLVLNNK